MSNNSEKPTKRRIFFGVAGLLFLALGVRVFFFEAISADGTRDIVLQILAFVFWICGLGLLHTGVLASDERVIKAFDKIRW